MLDPNVQKKGGFGAFAAREQQRSDDMKAAAQPAAATSPAVTPETATPATTTPATPPTTR